LNLIKENAIMKHLSLLLSMLLAACTVFPQTGGRPPGTEASQPVLSFQLETAVPGAAGSQPSVETQVGATRPVAADTPATVENDDSFDQQLADAIVSQDLAGMRALMGEHFVLAYWRSEGSELSADEALAQLHQHYFTPGADPVTDFSIDVTGLLDGSNPLNFFGPEAMRAFHITGLGPDADQQGIAAIARDPATGRRYWRGLLLIAGVQPQLGDLNAFAGRLAQALEAQDFTALRSTMRERFAIATWNNQLLEFASEDALRLLRQDALAAGASPTVIFDTDVPALLGGADLLSLWGPVANVVRALYVKGLGQGANQEAVIVIGRDEASNQFYWHGILLPPDGYFHTALTPEPGAVVPTGVQYIMALDDVNVRSGPGLNYAVEGLVAEGQIAQVSGRSADGNWWRIVCTQDASGFCWISADPQWTRPATVP
jgi:hypothetical protein